MSTARRTAAQAARVPLLGWAVMVAACSPVEPELIGFGGLYVAVVATNAPDENALYEISIDGVSIGASISGLENPQDHVAPGDHTVLAHVPEGCELEGANPVIATVFLNRITHVSFHMDCGGQGAAAVDGITFKEESEWPQLRG